MLFIYIADILFFTEEINELLNNTTLLEVNGSTLLSFIHSFIHLLSILSIHLQGQVTYRI